MPSLSVVFDPDNLAPGNGIPGTGFYALGFEHTINKIKVIKTNSSDLTLNLCVGQLKTDIFGESCTFALQGDKPKTFGDVSDGSDISAWKSWIHPVNEAAQVTSGDRPSYVSSESCILFDEGEDMDLPSSLFHFGASDEFTIFAALEEITMNSSKEAHILGRLNGSTSAFRSTFGIDNQKFFIRDEDENEEDDGTYPTSDSIVMISHHSNSRVWGYINGEEILNVTSLDGDFNFDRINLSEHRSGTGGSGTIKLNEMLVFDESITTMGATQRMEIEGYLGHKWSMNSSLIQSDGSTAHPYVSTDPRGSHTARVLGSDLATTKVFTGSDSVTSPPSFTAEDTWDEVGAASGAGGDIDQTVSADEYLQVVCEDKDEPGPVLMIVYFTAGS
jgi:hypothetical protein